VEQDLLARIEHDSLDRGPRGGASGSERFCAVTGMVLPVNEMIRFVLGPDGRVVPDLKRRLPGRGVWITGTRDALRSAIARKVFARGFKREVQIAPDLVDATERLIEQAALDALSIAHKAGKVAIGTSKAEAAIAREPVVGILHAAEAAPDGTGNLMAALRRRGDYRDVAVVEAFASAQLGLALGRSNVIHAALLAGPESDTFLARAVRLGRFRSQENQGRSTTSNRARKAKNWERNG
jgi:uncharacterized protein